MATPLFCLDLSEDARDYRHTALEPGLPLLDRQGVNYAILKKWLGDYVAEPEWRSQDVAAFFLVDDARGRLEDTDCQPVSKVGTAEAIRRGSGHPAGEDQEAQTGVVDRADGGIGS